MRRKPWSGANNEQQLMDAFLLARAGAKILVASNLLCDESGFVKAPQALAAKQVRGGMLPIEAPVRLGKTPIWACRQATASLRRNECDGDHGCDCHLDDPGSFGAVRLATKCNDGEAPVKSCVSDAWNSSPHVTFCCTPSVVQKLGRTVGPP